jgi:hypothetical protein
MVAVGLKLVVHGHRGDKAEEKRLPKASHREGVLPASVLLGDVLAKPVLRPFKNVAENQRAHSLACLCFGEVSLGPDEVHEGVLGLGSGAVQELLPVLTGHARVFLQ